MIVIRHAGVKGMKWGQRRAHKKEKREVGRKLGESFSKKYNAIDAQQRATNKQFKSQLKTAKKAPYSDLNSILANDRKYQTIDAKRRAYNSKTNIAQSKRMSKFFEQYDKFDKLADKDITAAKKYVDDIIKKEYQ